MRCGRGGTAAPPLPPSVTDLVRQSVRQFGRKTAEKRGRTRTPTLATRPDANPYGCARNRLVKRYFGNRGGGTRTPGLRFWRPPLYQLSYAPRFPTSVSPVCGATGQRRTGSALRRTRGRVPRLLRRVASRRGGAHATPGTRRPVSAARARLRDDRVCSGRRKAVDYPRRVRGDRPLACGPGRSWAAAVTPERLSGTTPMPLAGARRQSRLWTPSE